MKKLYEGSFSVLAMFGFGLFLLLIVSYGYETFRQNKNLRRQNRALQREINVWKKVPVLYSQLTNCIDQVTKKRFEMLDDICDELDGQKYDNCHFYVDSKFSSEVGDYRFQTTWFDLGRELLTAHFGLARFPTKEEFKAHPEYQEYWRSIGLLFSP